MPLTTIENTNKVIKITTTVLNVPTESDIVQELVDYLVKLHEAVPLTRLRCKFQSGNVWKYTMDAVDGRKWKQNLTIVPGQETLQTFDVSDDWKESEFADHRTVRARCIDLASDYEATDIDCQWN